MKRKKYSLKHYRKFMNREIEPLLKGEPEEIQLFVRIATEKAWRTADKVFEQHCEEERMNDDIDRTSRVYPKEDI